MEVLQAEGEWYHGTHRSNRWYHTFLAMAYILAVNPSMLAAARHGSGRGIYGNRCFSAAFATLIMGVFANYPVALASGMGLNAYFAYVVVPSIAEQGINEPWKIALTAVLVEGIIFIILSLFKFRETLVNAIPANLKFGITAGIGLFITIIGLKGAGITAADPATLVTLGNLSGAPVVLALVGLLVIAAMHNFKVKGAILWGILITWVLGIIAQLIGWYKVDVDAGIYSLIPSFKGVEDIVPPSLHHILQI